MPTLALPTLALPTVRFRDSDPAAFLAARTGCRRPEFLSPLTAARLRPVAQRGRIRLSARGEAGYLLTEDGDLQSVFATGHRPGAGAAAVADAVSLGATTLDCFDGFLPRFYSRFGFAETSRVAWDDNFAPLNWDYRHGRPDVVFMARI